MTWSNLQLATSLRVMLFVLAVGVGFGYPQAHNEGTRKWLTCDVDWLVSEPPHTGSNFTVRVSFHKKPISSARVFLLSEGSQSSLMRFLANAESQPREGVGHIVATSQTDSHGIAQFFAIPSGFYGVGLEGGLLTPTKEVEVDAASTASDRISLEWPGSTIVTRSLRGLLTVVNEPKEQPHPLGSVLVQLLDLRTAELLARTHSNAEGYYDFPSFSPGLYVLRVNEDQDPNSDSDDLAVQVVSRAIEDQMPTLNLDKVCNLGLSPLSKPPDQFLFERGMSAVEHGQFDVAAITLQTLINTYPDSEYVSEAKVALQEPQVANCAEAWSSSSQCHANRATELPMH